MSNEYARGLLKLLFKVAKGQCPQYILEGHVPPPPLASVAYEYFKYGGTVEYCIKVVH